MKYLRVLLTKYPGRFSRLLALLSGRGFTHASIGLEGDGRFYSFSSAASRRRPPTSSAAAASPPAAATGSR